MAFKFCTISGNFFIIIIIIIVNRLNMDSEWSETGDRYLLKLFRDYVFHQVTETGAAWIDFAQIVSTLNKVYDDSLCR